MRWGIIGALDAEVELIRRQMEPERTQEICGCKYLAGKIEGQEVVAVCCSVGTINAAVCTDIIIREFGATAVVNVGIAGSACKDLGILDVIVAQDVVFHDADLEILSKYYPFRKSFSADDNLRALCLRALESIPERGFDYRVGRIATGDLFVNTKEAKSRIIKNAHPLCIEMEGAAVGQTAHMHGIPFLVIRTLSDNAEEGAEQSYDDFLDKAAHQSAGILLEMLRLSRR